MIARHCVAGRGRLVVTVALALLLVGLLPAPPAHAAALTMTTGAYDGGVSAAKWAVADGRPGDCIGWRETFAMMFAISVHETAGGSTSTAVSPMTLSRWDGWNHPDRDNRSQYSDRIYNGFKRAHWNPGVGMFQLDSWPEVRKRHHAHRMNVSTAGRHVGGYLAKLRCAGSSRNAAMQSQWVACQAKYGQDGKQCLRTFNAIYNSGSGPSVSTVAGSQWDGGVLNRTCRWGTSNSRFGCYDIDVDRHQGWMDDSDPNGDGSRAPLANGFLTFHAGAKRYCAWLKSGTGYTSEKINFSATDQWPPPNNWYSNTSLQWYNSGSWTGY